jgi:hypothetical protein
LVRIRLSTNIAWSDCNWRRTRDETARRQRHRHASIQTYPAGSNLCVCLCDGVPLRYTHW